MRYTHTYIEVTLKFKVILALSYSQAAIKDLSCVSHRNRVWDSLSVLSTVNMIHLRWVPGRYSIEGKWEGDWPPPVWWDQNTLNRSVNRSAVRKWARYEHVRWRWRQCTDQRLRERFLSGADKDTCKVQQEVSETGRWYDYRTYPYPLVSGRRRIFGFQKLKQGLDEDPELARGTGVDLRGNLGDRNHLIAGMPEANRVSVIILLYKKTKTKKQTTSSKNWSVYVSNDEIHTKRVRQQRYGEERERRKHC